MSRKFGTVKSLSNWKSLTLNADQLSSGDFDGLVGIEELTEYTLTRENDSEISDEDNNDKEHTSKKNNNCEKSAKVKKNALNAVKLKHINENSSIAGDGEVCCTSKWKATALQSPTNKKSLIKKCFNSGSQFVIKSNVDVSDYSFHKELDSSKYLDNGSSSKMSTLSHNPIISKSKLVHTEKESINSENTGAAESEEKEETDILSGMDSWHGLGIPIPVLRALAQMKFTAPTTIQALTLPAAIFGRRDILGAAETGSGKTLAFGIPILCGILHEKFEDGFTEHLPHQSISFKTLGKNEFEQSREDGDDNSTSDHSEDESYSETNANDSKISEDSFDEGGLEKTELVKVIDNADFDFLIGEEKSKGVVVKKPLYALILTPTRELAIQVMEHLKSIAKYTDISIAVVVGGMSSQKQNRLLNRSPEIVVATPGRLWDLISEGHPHLMQIEDIRYLAIDETDRMLERGHFDELKRLLERINANQEQKQRRQNFVFSATLALTHDVPHYVKSKKKRKMKRALKVTPAQKLSNIMETVGLTNPKIVDITESSGVAYTLTEAHIVCSLEEKDFYLYYFLLRYPGRTLVFCNSINCVKRLTQLFSLLKCPISPLHANMHQTQRLKNLERFRDNSQCVLLATDVAARGLDIPKVQHVIHYQVPRTAESYVHRSGRTARAQQEGLTVIFVEPGEVNTFSRLFRTLGRDAILPIFPVDEKYMTAVKQRVNLARQLELYELQERRSTSERGWIGKLAKEMDIEISDDEGNEDEEFFSSKQEADLAKKKVAHHRKQLSLLLEKPIFPKGFSYKFPNLSANTLAVHGNSTHNEGDVEKSAINSLKQDVDKRRAEKRKHDIQVSEYPKGKRNRAS